MPLNSYTVLPIVGCLIAVAVTARAQEGSVAPEGPAVGVGDGPGETRADDDREWVEIGHGIRFGVGITRIDVSPSFPQLVYVGTDVGYIYRSVDGGVTWDELRLLPDDRPLLDVPLMNLTTFPLPNNGLVDTHSISVAPGTFRRPSTGPSNWSRGAEVLGLDGTLGLPRMTTRTFGIDQRPGVNAFALAGSGARVETEDPGNLMAAFFSGVSAQIGRVNWIHICASEPTIAYAATNFGAFRTSDMGITWDRVFIGSSATENEVRMVHCHPETSRVVLLATREGLRISRNGGDEWVRPTGNLGSWGSNFAATHPVDRRRILVGTGIGAYETVTGAEEETLYFEDTPAPDVRVVNAVTGTRDEMIMYVGTNDGASYTHDGGQTWHRVADFMLGHYRIRHVLADPRDPMHAYFQTDYHLFETRDGGESVDMILWGYTGLRQVIMDPRDPDTLWLVGYSQVWRYQRPRARPARLTDTARRAREALRRDPGQYFVMDAALEAAHIDEPTVLRIQRRMRRSALLPTVEVVAWYSGQTGDLTSSGVTRTVFHQWLASARCISHASPYRCFESAPIDQNVFDHFRSSYWAGFVTLTWPLGRAIMDERQTGRMWRDVFSMQNRIMYNVYDYWADRRRVLEYLAAGTATPEEELAYTLRLEEMSSVLDALTGGIVGGPFGEAREGGRR